MNKKKNIYLMALLPFLVVALLYEIVPLLMVIRNSFQSDTGAGITLENYQTIAEKLLYQKAIFNSVRISLVSSLGGIVVAFLGAKAIAESKGKIANLFMIILNMVSNFAGVPLAFAYMVLLGNAGFMVHVGQKLGISALADFNLYTSDGMSMIYIYFQIPLATLLLVPAFEGIRREWKEAVALLGGNMTCFWTKVGIPVLMPGIMGTFSVLFANALAAYATVYALMMNNISLLPIQIAGSFVGEVKLKPGLGGALSVVMMALMVIMIFVTNGISRQFQKGVKKA